MIQIIYIKLSLKKQKNFTIFLITNIL